MTPREWERLLLGATEEVRRRVSPLAGTEDGGRAVGFGAAGDTTIYADKVAEGVLLKALGKRARILSEEAGSLGVAGDALAVVDPLDGSSNFEHDIPFYCTSVAVVEGSTMEDISVGVVRDLVSGNVYSALRGKGARRNGKTVHTSKVEDLSKAVVGVDLSKGGREMAERVVPLVEASKRQVHFGANALELCYMAEGKTDAFVDLRGRIRITDLAAAFLIAEEAGATITRADGGRLDPVFDLSHRLSFIASANAGLHKQILELVGKGPRGKVKAI